MFLAIIYLSNIVKNFNTQTAKSYLDLTLKTFKDPVQVSVEKFENHHSINFIRNMMANLDNPNIICKYIYFVQALTH